MTGWDLLHQLATLRPHPESVPINMLVRVKGTPLAAEPPLDPLEMVRAIATARIRRCGWLLGESNCRPRR